jgi:nitrite reductase (NADH) small subunit
MPFTKLTIQSELPPPNEAREFSCGDRMMCVANVNGTISAMDNVCQHHGGPLGQGVIHKGKVVCPWHGWAYDPQTGAADLNPRAQLAVFPLKFDGDDVLIDLPSSQ